MGSPFTPKLDGVFGAVRQTLGLIRKVASKVGGLAGSTSTSADTTCDHIAGLDKIPSLVRGYVVRSGVGSYDCEVIIEDGQTIVCSSLSPILSDLYGVSQACMPVPGSSVLVSVPAVGLAKRRLSRGVILGVLSDNDTVGVSKSGESEIAKLADTDYTEGGVAQYTESGMSSIAVDRKYLYKGEFQCGRPHDIVPGEYALMNHAGSGLVIGALSTTIKGSESASVRCSSLDDQVRIVSGHYRHINAAGSEEIYNDGGFISVESSVSMYQPERLGVKNFGSPAFSWKTVDPISAGERVSAVTQIKPTQTAKKRLYRYSGYLGDVVNVFVSNPDPSKDVEDMASDSRDQGLLHYHADSSGRFTMRSAAGILLERYDRIPVPKRKHYSWDPEGDKAEGGTPANKKGFKLSSQYPMGIGLSLADMAAWWDHLSYARFEQFNKDFKVPKQEELKCPESQYDKIGNAEEEYSEYDKRHSYISLTPNGGLVLRDAWGSEIVMADGRITFNAAANIEIRSGSSVVVLGGDDVIVKGYNSVDLSASKKDVRIKAENNMQMVSMKRGVLIQSKAERDGASWSATGEDLQSTGVIIKADSSSVALVGKNAEMQGTEGVKIAAFNDKGKPSGNVVMAGKQITAVSSDNVTLTSGGASGIVVGAQSTVICAPSVLAIGGQSAAQAAGNKMLVGIPVEVGSMYSQVVAICKSMVQVYLDSVDWLNPFPPKSFSEIDFRFRSTVQYGTNKDSGMTGGSFSVYQPSWVALASSGRKWMSSCKSKSWDETPDAKNGYPWPGESAMQGSGYITYVEKNISSDGLENAVSGEAQLTPKGFSSYHIRDN